MAEKSQEQEDKKIVAGEEQEAPDTSQEQEEVEYTAAEQQAMKQGWKPLSEWEGDPSEHRGAKEFLDRGELLGKIKTLNTTVRETQNMLTAMSAHNQKVFKAGYERALVDFKAERKQAIRDGDTDLALELEEKIDQTKDALTQINRTTQQVQVPQGPSPVYLDWLEKNSWYRNDASLRHWANGMAAEFGTVNAGATEEEVYAFLHKEARKKFPELRETEPRKGPPGPDGPGRKAGAEGANKGGKGKDAFEQLIAGMSELDQRTARNLVKQGYLTKEKYVEDYQLGGDR